MKLTKQEKERTQKISLMLFELDCNNECCSRCTNKEVCEKLNSELQIYKDKESKESLYLELDALCRWITSNSLNVHTTKGNPEVRRYWQVKREIESLN